MGLLVRQQGIKRKSPVALHVRPRRRIGAAESRLEGVRMGEAPGVPQLVGDGPLEGVPAAPPCGPGAAAVRTDAGKVPAQGGVPDHGQAARISPGTVAGLGDRIEAAVLGVGTSPGARPVSDPQHLRVVVLPVQSVAPGIPPGGEATRPGSCRRRTRRSCGRRPGRSVVRTRTSVPGAPGHTMPGRRPRARTVSSSRGRSSVMSRGTMYTGTTRGPALVLPVGGGRAVCHGGQRQGGESARQTGGRAACAKGKPPPSPVKWVDRSRAGRKENGARRAPMLVTGLTILPAGG